MTPEEINQITEARPAGPSDACVPNDPAMIAELREDSSSLASRRFEVELSDLAAHYLGPNHRATVEKLAEAEAERLRHIERCKPKDKKERRPRGRPVLSPESRMAREIGKRLAATYIGLRDSQPAVFEEMYGEQFKDLNKAVEKDDLITLQWFDRERPWLQAQREARERAFSQRRSKQNK